MGVPGFSVSPRKTSVLTRQRETERCFDSLEKGKVKLVLQKYRFNDNSSLQTGMVSSKKRRNVIESGVGSRSKVTAIAPSFSHSSNTEMNISLGLSEIRRVTAREALIVRGSL